MMTDGFNLPPPITQSPYSKKDTGGALGYADGVMAGVLGTVVVVLAILFIAALIRMTCESAAQ